MTAIGSLPVRMRIGAAEEVTIGTLVFDLDGGPVTGRCGALARFLRAAADEVERSADVGEEAVDAAPR